MKDTSGIDRRRLLRATAAAVAAVPVLATGHAIAAPRKRQDEDGRGPRPGLRLALASYTCRKLDLDRTLAIAQRVGLDAICLKSFHLPLDATAKEIAACVAKTKDAGIDLYGGGVITMKKAPQVEQAFAYAAAAGMRRIICSPSPDVLSLVDESVQRHDIAACIHNHGPGDQHWPTPTAAYDRIAALDPRVGLCHDVAHTLRYGADPIDETRRCADRILDVHFRDIDVAAKEGRTVPCGRGVLDLAGVLRTLREMEYGGYVAFEYEAQPDDPLPGLAESVGYVRGFLAA